MKKIFLKVRAHPAYRFWFISICLLIIVWIGLAGTAWFYQVNTTRQMLVNQALHIEIEQVNKRIKEVQNLRRAKAELLDMWQVERALLDSKEPILLVISSTISLLPESVHVKELSFEGRKVALVIEMEKKRSVESLLVHFQAQEFVDNVKLVRQRNFDWQAYNEAHIELTYEPVGKEQ